MLPPSAPHLHIRDFASSNLDGTVMLNHAMIVHVSEAVLVDCAFLYAGVQELVFGALVGGALSLQDRVGLKAGELMPVCGRTDLRPSIPAGCSQIFLTFFQLHLWVGCTSN